MTDPVPSGLCGAAGHTPHVRAAPRGRVPVVSAVLPAGPWPVLQSVVLSAALAWPLAAPAQNRFGDAPSATPGQAGGQPQGGAGATPGQGVTGAQGAQGGPGPQGAGGLGAHGRPGGIADPRGQAPQGAPGGVDLARLEAHERQDHGVPPTAQLHRGPMHGGTPTSIPGGQVITTRGLVELVRTASAQGGGGAGQAPRVLFFDVLGGPERLPQALAAVPAHQAGSFDDAVQREFGTFLQQVTQGRQDIALVFYCASTQCWMSYNAALRASRLGYRQVLWYRGGIEAWKAAGLPLQGAGTAARR